MGEFDDPLTPTVPTSVTCAACGVSVPVGYPRCPRCHAPVPQGGRATRQVLRPEGGGTSLAPERGGSGILWALIGTAVVIGIAVGLWLLTRDDEPAPAAVVEEEAEDLDAAEEVEEEVAGDDALPPTAGQAAGERRREAIRALEETLRTEQLWSNVRSDGDTVTIESSLCDDPAMSPAIGAAVSDLRAAGVSVVECIAPHGGVVFSRTL